MATKSQRASVASLIDIADRGSWMVCLFFDNGLSDKQYRILVDGSDVVYQWGRTLAGGQTQFKHFSSPAAARKAALDQWAAKELKGYLPETGIMDIPDGLTVGRTVPGNTIVQHDLRHYNSLASAALRPGDNLWVVQLPYQGALRSVSMPHLIAVARSTGVGGIQPGGFCVVGVDDESAATLRQLCPIALPVAPDAGPEIAGVASALVDDVSGSTARERVCTAIEWASSICSL